MSLPDRALRQQLCFTPDNPTSLLAAAGACFEHGDRILGHTWLTRTIHRDPYTGDQAHGLAISLFQRGLTDAATALLGRLAELLPMVPILHDHLGLMRAQTHQAAAAIVAHRRAIVLAPERIPSSVNLGRALNAADRPEEARTTLRRAIALNPGEPTSWHEFAAALWKLEDLDGAGQALERVVRTAPDFRPAYKILGTALRFRAGPAASARIRSRSPLAPSSQGGLYAEDARRAAAGRPGYLVIDALRIGFWGEINHVVNQAIAADLMGRIPVVRWMGTSRYPVPGVANAWNGYFQPLSDVDAAELGGRGLTWFPPWQAPWVEPSHDGDSSSALVAMNRPEDVVVVNQHDDLLDILACAADGAAPTPDTAAALYRRKAASILKPRPEIVQRVDAVTASLARPFLAVHIRAPTSHKADESLEQRAIDLPDYIRAIDNVVAREPIRTIFLLTDYQPAIGPLKERYGDRLVHLEETLRLDRVEDAEVGLNPAFDSYRLATEVMTDAYVAAAADWFIGDGASGVTCSVVSLADWPPGRVRLLRQNVFFHRQSSGRMPSRSEP